MTFCVTSGKHDAYLEWPFSGTLRLTVAKCKGRGGHLTDMTTELDFEALRQPTDQEDTKCNAFANLFLPMFADSEKTLAIKCELI